MVNAVIVRDGKVLRSVDYRNLGAEELGSVYESLLELHAEVNAEAERSRELRQGEPAERELQAPPKE